MNQTMKIAVALIVAASLSTMVYDIPEQRAMAHPRLHLLSPDSDPDDFPFGPNSPDPSVTASKSDPPGPPFGPNCVGCVSTQNLANGAVTNPKLAPGSVSSSDIGAGQVMTPNIADNNITTAKIAPGAVTVTHREFESEADFPANSHNVVATVFCPENTVATGGGYTLSSEALIVTGSRATTNGIQFGWDIFVSNPTSTDHTGEVLVECSSALPGTAP